jgi:hypothetical protein
MRTYINQAQNVSSWFWSIMVTLGGLGFFLAGFSSYLKINLMVFTETDKFEYIPQGIVLMFYGSIGILLGCFLSFTLQRRVGSGLNDYDQNLSRVLIYRRGFPGKNERIGIVIPFKEIQSIKLSISVNQRIIYLCLRDGREIPLAGLQKLLTIGGLKSEGLSISKYFWESSKKLVPVNVEYGSNSA